MQAYVPVISSGKGLMLTTNRIAKGRAMRRFEMGLFYIQGSKKEALTGKHASHSYLNMQADAVTWVKETEATNTMIYTVVGTSQGRLSLRSLEMPKCLTQQADPHDVTFLCTARWRLRKADRVHACHD